MTALPGSAPAGRPLRIVHLTSAHVWSDTRIFQKECRTLAAAGFDVLLAAPDAPEGPVDGVRMAGVARGSGRLGRALLGNVRLARVAWRADGDAYHLHDPELLPLALLLAASRRRVVLDVHEHLPDDIRGKRWLRPGAARVLARVADVAERTTVALAADRVIAATPTIAARFPDARTTVVHNYPDLTELEAADEPLPDADRPLQGCYVGAITAERCIPTLVEALTHLRRILPDAGLTLAGPVRGVDAALLERPGVAYVGVLARPDVARLLGQVRFGVVLLEAVPNCIEGLPTKFFEYLAAGLPVVVSRSTRHVARLATEHGCGLAVDADDPVAVADAMAWLLAHPEEAAAMGARGRRLVHDEASWAGEGARLVAVYRELVGDPDAPSTGSVRGAVTAAPC